MSRMAVILSVGGKLREQIKAAAGQSAGYAVSAITTTLQTVMKTLNPFSFLFTQCARAAEQLGVGFQQMRSCLETCLSRTDWR